MKLPKKIKRSYSRVKEARSQLQSNLGTWLFGCTFMKISHFGVDHLICVATFVFIFH